MKNRYSTLLACCFPLFLAAQIDTTTFDWQTLPQPPVPVTSFARHADRLFAGTNDGLFFSDDFGVNWQQHPDFLTGIASVAADEHGVMVEKYVLGLDYPPYSADRWYYVYRSGDGGSTFYPPIEVKAGWFHYGGHYSSRVVRVNDQTLCYLDYTLGGLEGPGILHFTHDGGATWGEYNFEIKDGFVSLFASQDTVVIVRWANQKQVAGRLPAADMNSAQMDTLYFPQNFTFQTGGFEDNLFTFRNNQYFAFTQNQLAVSDDFGQTWQVDSLPIPAGSKRFSFSGDHFYVQMPQGVFRSVVSNPLDFSQVFTPANVASLSGTNYAFARLDDVSVTSNFGGLQLSFDNENTWQPPLTGPTGLTGTVVKAGGRFWIQANSGVWRSDPAVGQWELMTNPDFYVNPKVTLLTSPDSLLLGTRNGLLVISPDDGQTWLSTTNSPPFANGAAIHSLAGEDIYVLNIELISRLEAGGTWVNKPVPGLTNFPGTPRQLIARQDTILIFKNMSSTNSNILRFKSFDAGDNWQVDTLAG